MADYVETVSDISRIKANGYSSFFQVEYEGLKHEIKVLEEETALLNSQLEDALRLKDISESQLEEALDALKSEREQKNTLRKELAQHLTVCDGAFSSGCAHLIALSSAPPSGSATPTAATSPSSEDGSKCNGHLLQGAAGSVLSRLNGDFRSSSLRKSEILTPDLFSELNGPEILKLRQQIQQVSVKGRGMCRPRPYAEYINSINMYINISIHFYKGKLYVANLPL